MNWNAVYRHHGGASALTRALLGTISLRAGILANIEPELNSVILTYSVIPGLTYIWSRMLRRSGVLEHAHVFIGNCSGSKSWHEEDDRISIWPLYNDIHDVKIDRFIGMLGNATSLCIMDDDVMLLNRATFEEGLQGILSNNYAAISIIPRLDRNYILERDGIYASIGSHYVFVNLGVWKAHKLKFQRVIPHNAEAGWYYDTGDYATKVMKGSQIPFMINHSFGNDDIVILEGLSVWGTRIQARLGKIAEVANKSKRVLAKAYSSVIAHMEVNNILEELYMPRTMGISDLLLEAAQRDINSLPVSVDFSKIEFETRAKMNVIRAALTNE